MDYPSQGRKGKCYYFETLRENLYNDYKCGRGCTDCTKQGPYVRCIDGKCVDPKKCPEGKTPLCAGVCESVRDAPCCVTASGALSGTVVWKCWSENILCNYEYKGPNLPAGYLINCYLP
jgi:hypothetical protein